MTDTVLCHGVFDLLHPGHIEHLQKARSMGDRLVVSITADEYVNKGPGRPAYTHDQRAMLLSNLSMVDEVYICEDATALPAIAHFEPSFYVKGPDYLDHDSDTWRKEQAAVIKCGGKVRFTEGETHSSSRIINTFHGERHPTIDMIRERWGYEGVTEWLDKAAQLSAVVIGECIVDEYVKVSPRWKSAKENVIDFVSGEATRFQGGAWAVQRHAREFCKEATLIRGDYPPITKRRYVDETFGGKLFAVADRDTISPARFDNRDFTEDLTIVADFGHGLIDEDTSDDIVSKAKYLALTVQSNGLNWGFNTLSKWDRADYVVVDEPEIRLAWQDRHRRISILLGFEAVTREAGYVVATLGHRGCAVHHIDSGETVEVPALASKVVDRIGAGDAFLACTASLAAVGAPPEIIGLVGNAAGGLQVGTIGNSEGVTRARVNRVLRSVLA